ncbi:uncharacterized protein LOC131256994 [Magnolia sinica]|uniref:uncharacterized protein LOC131256994 n=1 Tax=Magnolia sinica TaxID=86752 RepID=UPI002657FBFF|nr:uncharacterized protein LOC131256994 [Magnolia sinica]
MGHHGHDQNRSSWGCTMLTQAALCVGMYMAFYIGTPMKSNKRSAGDGRALDLHFLTVSGGQRPPKQQAHLLKQMEKVAKTYKVKFVINISELGEDDPLLRNGTLHFPSLKIPWYTTISRASQEQGRGYFLSQVTVPPQRTLDIIGLETGSLQDLFRNERLSDIENDQLHWLMRTLAASDSEWRIVVGFHPLIVCDEHATVTTRVYESLHQIFLNYQVKAYLSKHGCTGYYNSDRGIVYIENPGHVNENHRPPSVNETSNSLKEMHDGFLLHRVSSLEFVSYFINSAGKVMFKSTIYQRGKEIM